MGLAPEEYLPVKDIGLPLKNFVAPQLGVGGGGRLRILNY